MRVLHTVNSIREDHGGPSRTIPGLVDALTALGVEARLHVADRDGPLPDGPDADLVHDHGLWLPANHRAARVAHRAGLPRIVSPRGMLEPWALAHRAWKKRLAWRLYQRADLARAAVVHATSEAEAGAVRAAGVPGSVAVLPNGVSLPPSMPGRTAGAERRALFLSRLHPKKGLPMLIDAWARVRPPGWTLVLAGPDEGGHASALRAQIEAAGLDVVVSLPGPVADDEKWTLYRSADLFVLPTYSENFGLVVAEALVAGLPVLTTTGTPWQALVRERAGWWVAPEPDALAAALAEATARPPDELRSMGERGHAYAVGAFGWPAIAESMAEVYRWVLGHAPRPACLTMEAHPRHTIPITAP